MREILFRGKRKDNGKWIEGGIAFNGDRCFITCRERYKPDTRDIDTVEYYEKYPTYNIVNIEVKPETVRQFTGLTDHNGKRIFENDIIKHYNDTAHPENYATYQVKWYAEKAKFVVVVIGKRERYEMRKGLKYEVIGNIHDNGDLLKGGAE